MLQIQLSRIWKERILDLVRIFAIVLAMYTMWLVNSGDPIRYNIPVIVTIFMVLNIAFIIILGEYNRLQEYSVEALEKELQELKKKS